MSSNKTKKYMQGAEPFEFAGGDSGVLLMHGFSGSCFEVRELGALLKREGYGVLAPVLAGHGTHPDDLSAINSTDFFSMAEDVYRQARSRYAKLYIVGQSMGGTLGLHLAAHHPVDGIVTIAAPVYMAIPIERGIPLAHRWSPWRNVVSNFSAWRGEVVGYRTTPTSSLLVFLEVLEYVRKELPAVRAPLLALHSTRDETVPASNADYIVSHVSSDIRRSRVYPAGRHLMTVPPQLAIIAPDVLGFLRELESGSAAPSREASKGA
ncbi:MAG: alpha/beta fold hydrolase [Candidatus Eremiobacteraeota bacterium]|nr:alpha/beta fold hydrolase [Candidatus Eremiobacteraeota bacterium]